jgi:hypothetical protein
MAMVVWVNLLKSRIPCETHELTPLLSTLNHSLAWKPPANETTAPIQPYNSQYRKSKVSPSATICWTAASPPPFRRTQMPSPKLHSPPSSLQFRRRPDRRSIPGFHPTRQHKRTSCGLLILVAGRVREDVSTFRVSKQNLWRVTLQNLPDVEFNAGQPISRYKQSFYRGANSRSTCQYISFRSWGSHSGAYEKFYLL